MIEALVEDCCLPANLREEVAVEVGVAASGRVRQINVSDPTPVSSSTMRRLPSIQAKLRKPRSSSTGTTVTSRDVDPSGLGPTLSATCFPTVSWKRL